MSRLVGRSGVLPKRPGHLTERLDYMERFYSLSSGGVDSALA
jgi:hypothetical protein